MFHCELCNNKYKTKSGLWKHNNKNHLINSSNDVTITITRMSSVVGNNCRYCNKSLASRQSRWRHENNCDNKNIIETKITDLENKMNLINKPILLSKYLFNMLNDYITNIKLLNRLNNTEYVIKTMTEILIDTYEMIVFNDLINNINKKIIKKNLNILKKNNNDNLINNLKLLIIESNDDISYDF